MGKFFDKISGNKDARKNTAAASGQAQFDPFSFQSAFGNASISKEGLSVGDSPGASLAPGFEGLASLLQGSASGNVPTGLGISGADAFSQAQQAGQGGIGGDFLSAARQSLGGISSFNPDEFAANRFQQLQGLARPGEERAASSLANRLFSRGRLGGEDTQSGRAFGELDQAQSQAETMRFLQAEDSANNQLQSRIGAASGLANTGTGLQGQGIQQFLASLGGGAMASQNQNQTFNTQLQGSLAATQGINSAFAPQMNAIQALLGGSALTQRSDLAGASIQAGFDPTKGAEAAGSAAGGLVGGLFSDLTLKSNVEPIGTDSKGRTIYKWEWNDTAKEMGIDHQPTEGYVAQELLGSDPQAVRISKEGYLMVALEAL